MSNGSLYGYQDQYQYQWPDPTWFEESTQAKQQSWRAGQSTPTGRGQSRIHIGRLRARTDQDQDQDRNVLVGRGTRTQILSPSMSKSWPSDGPAAAIGLPSEFMSYQAYPRIGQLQTHPSRESDLHLPWNEWNCKTALLEKTPEGWNAVSQLHEQDPPSLPRLSRRRPVNARTCAARSALVTSTCAVARQTIDNENIFHRVQLCLYVDWFHRIREDGVVLTC